MSMLARSDSRNGTVVRALAVHTTEGILRAAGLRDWTSWPGSSHASADQDGVLLTPADGFVPYDRAAWTIRSGNPWTENIELCGFAAWTRAEWLARPKLLDACARWLADRAKARGIPLVKLTPAQYRAGGAGVIGHVDHTIGYSDGTHTDPGKDFPYDVVLPAAQAILHPPTPPEDFMATMSDAEKALLMELVHVFLPGKSGRSAGPGWLRVDSTSAGVAQLLGKSAPTDPSKLAAAIVAAIPDDLAKQVADELGKRLNAAPTP